jgi:predicted ester cyclase
VQITEYERTWVEALNRGDVSIADGVFAPECVIHINGSPDPNLSVDGFKQMMSGLLAAFPDLHLTIDDQSEAGGKVATRWSAEGTNTGPFGTVAATGRRVRVNGLILDRVVGGRVVERWEQWDQMGMMQQLGLV